MINLTTGWFKIFEILMYDLDEVTNVNGEYVYKSSAGVSQLFNNTWLCRYPRLQKAVLDNRSKFKQYFNPLLKEFNIKPALTTIKKPTS